MRVAGSLWSVPPEELEEEATRLADAGLDVWHWDCADGTIGPAGGFTPDAARRLAAATGLRSEAHLMLADPRPHIDAWTSFCELVVVHVESPHWREAVALVHAAGQRAGLAISPMGDVPTDLHPELAILVMTVTPGNAGTGFLADRLDILDGLGAHRLRGVDGSINVARAIDAHRHGANWIVSGTSLAGAPDPREWLGCLPL